MIETKEYQLTQKEYLKILILNRIRNKVWWLMPIILLLGIRNYLQGDDFGLFFIVFPLLYPILVLIQLKNFTSSIENRNIYLKRKILFDSEKLIISANEDLADEIPFDYVVKMAERKDYWLLYFNKSSFHYIPKNIFNTIEDYEAFQNLLTEKTKTVKRI